MQRVWQTLVTPLYPSALCSGDGVEVPTQLYGVSGKSVNFTAAGSALSNYQTLTWMFDPPNKNAVPLYTAGAQQGKVGSSYTGRVTFNRSTSTTSTLQLQSLTAADSGTYILTVIDSNLESLVGETKLQVLGMLQLIVGFTLLTLHALL